MSNPFFSFLGLCLLSLTGPLSLGKETMTHNSVDRTMMDDFHAPKLVVLNNG